MDTGQCRDCEFNKIVAETLIKKGIYGFLDEGISNIYDDMCGTCLPEISENYDEIYKHVVVIFGIGEACGKEVARGEVEKLIGNNVNYDVKGDLIDILKKGI